MAPPLSILFLAPYLPFPPHGGGQLRIYHMLRLLGQRHDVHLLTFGGGWGLGSGGWETKTSLVEQRSPIRDPRLTPDSRPWPPDSLPTLQEFCTVEVVPAPTHTLGRRLRAFALSALPDLILRGQEPRFAAALSSILARQPFDIVQAESLEMAQYVSVVGGQWPVASGRQGTRKYRPTLIDHRPLTTDHRPLICYDAFNAEYVLQRRAFLADLWRVGSLPAAAYSLVQWLKLRRYERRLARNVDLTFAVSDADRRALQRLDPGLEVEVVPNGVDTDFYQPRTPNPQPPTPNPYVLFTGTLDFRPNVDAVTWFVRTIWEPLHIRRPGLRFCVVGQRPAEAIRQLERVAGVEIVGAVDDVRPWFREAAAYVLPMRIGGGVRLKLLETWAMGLPCVTTTVGAEGVAGFQPGTHALVADDPASFRRAVEQLLDDQALAARLAAAGRRLVVERYDWRPIMEGMERAWLERIEWSAVGGQ